MKQPIICLGRTVQPYLEDALGGTIAVINVPGSGSVGGSRRVIKAQPDGDTILACSVKKHHPLTRDDLGLNSIPVETCPSRQ